MLKFIKSTAMRKAVSMGLALSLMGGQLLPVLPREFTGIAGAWAGTIIRSEENSIIGPGVTYRKANGNMDGLPQQINQVILDSTSEYINLRASAPHDVAIGQETVSSQARRQSGPGAAVIAAVNGDFFYLTDPLGMPVGMQIRDGEIISAPGNQLVFGVTTLGVPFITKLNMQGTVSTVGEQVYSRPITVVNKRRLVNDLAVYTPSMGSNTRTNNLGTELVVTGLNLPVRPDQVYNGIISQKRVGAGSTAIPSDGVVLSGHGLSAQFLNKLQVGDAVTFSISFGKPDIAQALGGITKPVTDGRAITAQEAAKLDTGLRREPRTVVGLRGHEIIITTVDGRQPGISAGMTLPELGNFLVDQGIQQALNLDGGGSTAFVVRRQGDAGVILGNRPSDGHERNVANSLQVVNTAPPGEITHLLVTPSNNTIFTSSTQKFSFKALDQYYNPVNGTDKQVNWSVDEGLGTIDSNGLFTAGPQSMEGRITATVEGATVSTPVKIVNRVSRIALYPNPLIVEPGGTGKLQVLAWDENEKPVVINNGGISWTTSGGIGTMASTGVFSGVNVVKEGRITATVGDKVATVKAYTGRPPVVIEDFENLAGWQATQLKALTSLNLNSPLDPVQSGFSSGKLIYNFAPGGKAATGTSASYAQYQGRLTLEGKPLRLGVWVFGDNKGHWLRSIYYDGKGKKRYLEFTPKTGVNWTGWQYVTAALPKDAPAPLKLESIYLAEDRVARKGAGVIFLDDLTAEYTDGSNINGSEISLSLPALDGGFATIDVPVEKAKAAGNGKYVMNLNISGADMPKLNWKKVNLYKLQDDGSLKMQPTRLLPEGKTLKAVINGLGEYQLKENPVVFTDVTAKSPFGWALSDIEEMASKQIITGKGQNNFEPGAGVTRAEFIAMLVRAMGITVNPAKQVVFKDISSSQWYANPVRIAVSNGITNGFEDGTFRPDKPITRLEMALLLCRAAKLVNQSEFTVESGVLTKYRDRKQVPKWAVKDLSLAIQLGLMQGKTNNMLYFNDKGQRAEAAVLIKRYYDKFGLMEK
ncbi:MAG TPA: S-layer homology domain-containing protein [Bacillota bacterium]|nr:S-layer homology domain-containing protein [Bacillota bacterium]